MARQSQIGLRCKVYRNSATYGSPTWGEGKRVKDASLSLGKDRAEIYNRQSEWKKAMGAGKEFSISFGYDHKIGGSDTFFAALYASYLNGTMIEFAFMDGNIATSGSDGFRAPCEVMEMELTHERSGIASYEFTIEHTEEDSTGSDHIQDPERYTVS